MAFRIIHSGNFYHVWNVKCNRLNGKFNSKAAAVRFVSLLGGKVVQ